MAKTKSAASPKRPRGRPPAEIPLEVRVLCRLDLDTKAALDRFAKKLGEKPSGALREIVKERLEREGFLK